MIKKFKSIFLILLVTVFLSAQQTDNYQDQGGAHWHIKGTLTVESAGIFNVVSGGFFKLDGTDMTTQLGYLSGVTAGTAASSKCLVLGSSGEIATITTATFTTATSTNLNVGLSGTGGTFKLYPATASRGYFALTIQNQTGDTAVTIDADAMGQATVFNLGDPGAAAVYFVISTLQLTLAEMDRLDGITAGTAYASKALVLGSSLEISQITTAGITNLDVGKDATKGVFTLYPTTTNRGTFIIDLTDQTGDTDVTLTIGAMGQGTVVNLTDPGGAASYLVQSTAALTLAEADFLDGATAGTQVASKVVIADTNVNTGISKVTELHIGATGSEIQVTATAAEINILASGLARSELTEDALAIYGIPIYSLRAADLAAMGIAETAGDHYLLLTTDELTLISEITNNETEVSISWFQFVIPPEYVSAGDVKVRVKHTLFGAGTDGAGGSTVDIAVFEQDGNGATGSDLSTTTAATTITKGSWATTDFVITAAGLVAGDILNVTLTTSVAENASNNLQAEIDGLAFLLDIKG